MKLSSTIFYFLIIVFSLTFTNCDSSSKPAKSESETFKFLEADIAQLHEGYISGSFTVTELVQSYIQRIEEIDKNGPAVNSVLMVNPDALSIAEELDSLLKSGIEPGPLFGIPILLKDNIDTKDKMPCTAGSRALEASFPLQDAFLVTKLREAGAVILGKANLSEWANFRGELSSSGWSGILGQTKNPYVLDRNPCGSSSGSGVSVAANLTVLAIGTETNGSIVCPSNNNGIVGIKPTVGLISRSGIIPISFTQDSGGPMARTVTDAAICLGVMTGIDSNDSKTAASEGRSHPDYTLFLNADGLKGKKLGIFTGPLNTSFSVDTLFYRAIDEMKKLGAEFVEIDEIAPPGTGSKSFQVMLYEYKDGLNKYFASLGPDAKIKNLEELIAFNNSDSVELQYYDQRYLEMASEKASLESDEFKNLLAELKEASQKNGIDRVLAEHGLDAIVAPTGSPAWKTDLINGDNYIMSSSSPAAWAGYPNVTLPMGFVGALPVNISFFGTAWSEPLLIEIAYAYEQATMHRKAPEFLSSYLP
jgi:amidase